jgi:hypothetical protein
MKFHQTAVLIYQEKKTFNMVKNQDRSLRNCGDHYIILLYVAIRKKLLSSLLLGQGWRFSYKTLKGFAVEK